MDISNNNSLLNIINLSRINSRLSDQRENDQQNSLRSNSSCTSMKNTYLKRSFSQKNINKLPFLKLNSSIRVDSEIVDKTVYIPSHKRIKIKKRPRPIEILIKLITSIEDITYNKRYNLIKILNITENMTVDQLKDNIIKLNKLNNPLMYLNDSKYLCKECNKIPIFPLTCKKCKDNICLFCTFEVYYLNINSISSCKYCSSYVDIIYYLEVNTKIPNKVICPNESCDLIIPYLEYIDHVFNNCHKIKEINNIAICQFCDEEFNKVEELVTHEVFCDKALIFCFICKEKFKRIDFSSHLNICKKNINSILNSSIKEKITEKEKDARSNQNFKQTSSSDNIIHSVYSLELISTNQKQEEIEELSSKRDIDNFQSLYKLKQKLFNTELKLKMKIDSYNEIYIENAKTRENINSLQLSIKKHENDTLQYKTEIEKSLIEKSEILLELEIKKAQLEEKDRIIRLLEELTECIICNCKITYFNINKCFTCKILLCSECCCKCNNCKNSYCKNDLFQCQQCNLLFCHNDLYLCEGCNTYYCINCHDDFTKCNICELRFDSENKDTNIYFNNNNLSVATIKIEHCIPSLVISNKLLSIGQYKFSINFENKPCEKSDIGFFILRSNTSHKSLVNNLFNQTQSNQFIKDDIRKVSFKELLFKLSKRIIFNINVSNGSIKVKDDNGNSIEKNVKHTNKNTMFLFYILICSNKIEFEQSYILKKLNI